MKTIYKKLLFLLLLLPVSVLAQSKLTGTVLEKSSGMPLPGVSVVIQGTTNGTSTDLDGKFTLSNVKNGDKIVFSYLGYTDLVQNYSGQNSVTVSMEEQASELQEVVVQIGYGAVKKKDATGSITTVTSKDFNKGSIVSADQLLVGKAAGVRITNNGGAPDAAPNIRIRGGASLNANNSPLIVIDNVPVDNTTPAGVNNPLSLINPNDIESFTVLKDASATAIYGSRASNGVIIITTKRGSTGAMKYNFSSSVTVGTLGRKIDMMTGPEFTRFIEQYAPNLTNALGIDDPNSTAVDDLATPGVIEGRILYNTDWQDEITRTSVSVNHNFTASGSIFKSVPFRASIGSTSNQGLVKTSDYERLSGSFKLNPSLLNDHLKIDINGKTTFAKKNEIDNDGALGNAVNMDPTKPVYNELDNTFGGYYFTTRQETDGRTNVIGAWNPVAVLMQRSRPNTAFRFLGNMELDYKMHFLPELRAVVNLGLDANIARIKEIYDNNAVATYKFNDNTDRNVFNPGLNYKENQTMTNTTMDAYLAYGKTFGGIINRFDIQAGYNYQNFKNDGNKVEFIYNPTTGLRQENVNPNNLNNRYYNVLNLQSFFARTNIDFLGKYLVTLSIRRDESSLWRPENRVGYFPAAALAWRLKEESFLKNVSVVNDMKLRFGYGKTGQQDITGEVGFYPSVPLFQIGSVTSQYLPGSNLYSADPFNPNLTWEKTTTYNAGIDFDFFKNSFFSGSFDIYKRETTDLLATIPQPPGQALKDTFIDNVGSTDSKGFELNTVFNLWSTDKANLSFNANIAYNHTEVTDLKDVTIIPTKDGDVPFSTGAKLTRNAVGQQAQSAWVFEQLYDADGNPIVDSYVDRNGDNKIDNNDRYFKAIRPNWTFGFGFNFNYCNWDLSSSFRGQFGGQVYNARRITSGFISVAIPVQNTIALTNVLDFYSGAADPSFVDRNTTVVFSDYFLEDATFLRCENIVLGYKFNKFYKSSSLRIYGAVNNAFVLTKYTGQDPENFGGIDNNFYPRPRAYTVGLSLDF